jgi:hypothetical protein
LIQQALSLKISVSLINSVWQDMDLDWKPILKKLHYWGVRDRLSYQYARECFGLAPDLTPDFSWYVKPNLSEAQSRTDAVVGGFFQKEFCVDQTWPVIYNDLFSHTWQSWHDQLSRAMFLLSGRHHEIYGACLAKCPFIPVAGNSWKIQGLLANAGANIPVLDAPPTTFKYCHYFIEKYQSQYQILWDWLEKQLPPDSSQWVPHEDRQATWN